MEPDDAVFRGVEFCGGIPEGGGFSRSDFSGEQGHGAEADGVIETLDHGSEVGGLVDVIEAYPDREGFLFKAEEGAIGVGHDFLPFPQRLPPR